MINDRDITCRTVATGDDLVRTPVGEAMSKGVTYGFEDQDVGEAAI